MVGSRSVVGSRDETIDVNGERRESVDKKEEESKRWIVGLIKRIVH